MGHCFIEAIRSVTHLVLAPEPKKLFWFFFFSFLYIKSFFVLSFLIFLPISAPIPPRRDQKTFSTGPRSFSL